LTRFAIKKVEEEDHDDKDNSPKDQIFIKRTQKFSSNIVKFEPRLT
jgi:hypothetical protein